MASPLSGKKPPSSGAARLAPDGIAFGPVKKGEPGFGTPRFIQVADPNDASEGGGGMKSVMNPDFPRDELIAFRAAGGAAPAAKATAPVPTAAPAPAAAPTSTRQAFGREQTFSASRTAIFKDRQRKAKGLARSALGFI